MNEWQILRQLRYLARTAAWSSGDPVFQTASVVISAEIVEVLNAQLSFPLCVVGPAEAVVDPEAGEEPGLVAYTAKIVVAASIPSDASGQGVLLGANRSPAHSGGRGVLEIIDPLLAVLRRGTDENGLRISAIRKGDSGAMKPEARDWIGWVDHRVEVLGTDAKFFHPATKFRAATPGGGVVSLSWQPPPSRFDYRRMILRRASGSTPPASATSGTGITLGGSPDGRSATSVSDSPGAGTWSYALFAAYDDYTITPATQADAPTDAGATDKDTSAAATIAGLVVT